MQNPKQESTQKNFPLTTKRCVIQQPERNGHLIVQQAGATDAPQILVLGGISGSRGVIQPDGSGWWQTILTGIDLTRFGVISLDYAGGVGESSVTPLPASVTEHAEVIALGLAELGLTKLHAVIGGSFGGSVALAVAQQPQLDCERVVVIGGAHRAHAYAIALRRFQREFAELGKAAGQPELGVQLARALAMLGYRNQAEFDTFFNAERDVFSYAMQRAGELMEKSPERAANLFRVFGPAMDSLNIDVSGLTQPTLLIGFDSDQLVPPALMHELEALLPNCAGCHIYASSYGHDGFIKDAYLYAEPLLELLTRET